MPLVIAEPFSFIANFPLFCQKGKSLVLTAKPFYFISVCVFFILCWESILLSKLDMAPRYFLLSTPHPKLNHHEPPSPPPLPPHQSPCIVHSLPLVVSSKPYLSSQSCSSCCHCSCSNSASSPPPPPPAAPICHPRTNTLPLTSFVAPPRR
jgi:hypothetical protein